MRFLVFTLLLIPAAAQQSQVDTYTYDANGRRVLDSQLARGEQRLRNLNGRVAPIEKVEEKVLSDDSAGRVVEKTIRSFDANGNPLPAQRIRTTERKQPDGTKTTDTEIFAGNINGGLSLTERSQAVERKSGDRTTIETQVARPTINGSFETVEKRSATIVKTGDKTNEEAFTYRRDANGGFYAAVRELKETEKKDNRTVENATTYIQGERRQLELAGQTVSEITRRADGSETRQVSIFGTSSPGRPATGQPTLREQQIVEKSKTASGAVETFSIRRPAVDNPNALGPARKISEKICTGICQ